MIITGYPEYTIDRTGEIKRNGVIKSPRLGTDGYYAISLMNPTTDNYDAKRIKDLVARAYLPNDEPTRKKYLGVKDGDKKNHHVDNLIWRTEKEHGQYSSSKPVDISETRTCGRCNVTKPMTDFPLDHPDHNSDEPGHRRKICQSCITASRKPMTLEQKRKRKDRQLRTEYGVSLEQYYEMLKKQEGKCANAACAVDITGRGHNNLDHCHTSGQVRGLLCPNCNKALGMVGDDSTKLSGLIAYLEKTTATARPVKMPTYGSRVNPVKTGEQHANTGKVRSEAAKKAIAEARKETAARKYEELFSEQLKQWVADPNGDAQKNWRYSVSRKHREGNLPQSCIDALSKIPAWTYSKGTSHSTDSRVQRLTPAAATPPAPPPAPPTPPPAMPSDHTSPTPLSTD